MAIAVPVESVSDNPPPEETGEEKSWTPWGAAHAAVMEPFRRSAEDSTILVSIPVLMVGQVCAVVVAVLVAFCIFAGLAAAATMYLPIVRNAKPQRRIADYQYLRSVVKLRRLVVSTQEKHGG